MKKPDSHYSELLSQKLAAGLPKEDAHEVVKRQRAHDESLPEAAEEAPKGKSKGKAAEAAE